MNKQYPYSRSSGSVDAGNAIDWDHPDNRGLCFQWSALPGVPVSGGRLIDLTKKMPYGVVTGGAAFVGTGLGQLGLLLNGTTGFASFGTSNVLPFSSDYTVAATIFARTNNASRTIASQRSSFAIGSNLFQVGGNVTAVTSTKNATFANGAGSYKWSTGKYIRVLFSSSVSSGYIFYENGLLRDSAATAMGTASTGTGITFRLGATDTTTAEFFDGILADVRIWSRTFTAQQAYADYTRSFNITADDRLHWFSTRSYSLPGGGTNRRRRIICGGIC